MNCPDDHVFVIFGASGDLTKRKLIPALYSLFVQQLLPERFVLLGAARTPMNDETFRSAMRDAIRQFKEIEDVSQIESFLLRLHYVSIDPSDASAYKRLRDTIQTFVTKEGLPRSNVAFYLSTPPNLYGIIPVHLAACGLHEETNGWKRLVIEKPFGTDLTSAQQLSDILKQHWNEQQVYRIDHYLGKETVQNVMVTRFSNGIFEPLWNRNFIHHVEITAAESLGVEQRGGYYETSGALRDMVQNHLLQVVGLTAMEPPSSLDSSAIRYEIMKVFQSLRPLACDDVKRVAVRGQYLASHIRGEAVAGYREESGVAGNSTTETYAALKFYIDNWRWGGVPFYVRTGKRLPTRVTEVVIHFKPTPHALFSTNSICQSGNQLVIRIQPDEGILLKFGMKMPGAGFDVEMVNMDFHYSSLSHQRIPSAYERLLYDAMNGDVTLYARTDEVMAAWKFLTPVLECWKNDSSVPLYGYPAGTWGPEFADRLIEGDGTTWRYPCKNLADDGQYCEL